MPIRNDGRDGETRWKSKPAKELSKRTVTLIGPEGDIERSEDGTFTKKGALAAGSRKRRVTKWKPPVDIGPSTDLVWDECIAKAVAWYNTRCNEHKKMLGHLSAGVSALLNEAKLSLAKREYYVQLALRDPKDRHYLTQSGRAADSFTKQMLAAWELAMREGRVLDQIKARQSHRGVGAAFSEDEPEGG